MSEIRERAKIAAKEMKLTGWDRWAATVTDLLAELERVENALRDRAPILEEAATRIAELEAENERMKADLSGRLFVEQAAERAKMKAVQECVEIANKLVHVDCADQWSIPRTGAFIAFADAIKYHFKLEGK